MKTIDNADLQLKAQPYQHKDVRFDVKAVGEEGQFEGLASVYDVKDQGGDIVEKGAFTKTLQERGNEVPILWQHDSGESIGLGVVEETPKGLSIKGQLELDLPEAQSAYIRLKKRLVKGLSIGYKSIPSRTSIEGGVRRLKEVILYEVSLVTFPMNEMAQVTSVKADDDPAVLPPPESPPVKTHKWQAVTFQNFAAEEDRRRAWDPAAANLRACQWLSGGAIFSDSEKWTPIQWRKFRSLHLSVDDSAPEKVESYKFPVADIIDGEPRYCWAAVRAALKESRAGEKKDAAIEDSLAKIYRKFDKELPTKEQADLLAKDFDAMYRMILAQAGTRQTLDALSSCLMDCMYDGDMTAEEKMADSATSIAQFERAYMMALPEKLAAMDEASRMGGMYMMAQGLLEQKLGARNNAADRKRIEDTITVLEEATNGLRALLMDDAAAKIAEPEVKGDDDPGTSTPDAAMQDSNAPDQIHSLLEQLNDSFKENI